MSGDAVITMVLVLGTIVGGFVGLVSVAVRAERQKQQGGSPGDGSG